MFLAGCGSNPAPLRPSAVRITQASPTTDTPSTPTRLTPTTSTSLTCPPAPTVSITSSEVDHGQFTDESWAWWITVEGTVSNPSAVPVVWDVELTVSYLPYDPNTGAIGARPQTETVETYAGPNPAATGVYAPASAGNGSTDWYSYSGLQAANQPSVTGTILGWSYPNPALESCDRIPSSMASNSLLTNPSGTWGLWQQEQQQ